MGAIEPITLKSWSDLTDIANKLDNENPLLTRYAFRGQSDCSWDLSPSLLRHFDGKIISEKDALNIESQALDEFKSQAHLHLSNAELESTKDTFSWWSVMQHHGAPTRLLDWSFSIYVALYFSVTGNFSKDGALWLLHINESVSRMKSEYGECKIPGTEQENLSVFLTKEVSPHILFIARKCKSARMISQQGFFAASRSVLGHHGETLESMFSDSEPKEYFRKLIIPAHLKREFVVKLRRMNVTASSLFPGLDGVGKSINELVQVVVR